tara:strand:+ start:4401 stop:5165 length:765 start_codon:yes stop_codon:yes gene_type:complete
MANWPVSLTSLTEGTIIKASDLEGNFDKLRNAVNTLHDRFSTFQFNCFLHKSVPKITNGVGSAQYVHHVLSDFKAPANLAAAPLLPGTDQEALANEKRVVAMFQLPSWAQAVRLRRLDVLNSSVVDVDNINAVQDSAVSGTSYPPQFGVSYASAVSSFNQSSATLGTEVSTTVSFPSSTAPNYAGYSSQDLASGSTNYPVHGGADLNQVVLGGQFVAIWARGGYRYEISNATTLGETQYHYNITLTCDAMVPVP